MTSCLCIFYGLLSYSFDYLLNPSFFIIDFVFYKKLYNPLDVIYVLPQINVFRFFNDVKYCIPLSVTLVVSKLRKTKFGNDAIDGNISSPNQ